MPTTPSRDRYLFRPGRAAVALTAALILGCSSSSSGTSTSPPELVIASVATGGAQGDNNSMYNSLSGDGRAVAFETQATNLGGSVTAVWNIYLREPASSRTTLLSRGWDNSAADDSSRFPSLDDSAAHAAFESLATNLIPDQSPPAGQSNVYIVDIAGGTVTRASISWDNTDADGNSFAPSLSGDGRLVAFWSEGGNLTYPVRAPGSSNVYVRHLSDNTTRLVSVASDNVSYGNGRSFFPVISRNGRYVAFQSLASDLVAGDTNARRDVFLRDLRDNTTTRVSVDNTGGQLAGLSGGPSNVDLSVSVDGRYIFVAFVSDDNTIVPFDNNGSEDVFLRVIDTVTGTATTELVSAAAGGNAVGNGYSDRPSVSDDGRYVLFRSKASNLVNTSDPPGVPEYYLRDRSSGTTRQISRSGEPDGSNKSAGYGSMSGDGAVVSFEHGSANLVAGDSNGKIDVFVLGAR